MASALFFNDKGYVTEEELINELANWKEILDYIETILLPLSISIKHFKYKGLNCYTIQGFPSSYDAILSDKEALMLIDFVVRFEILSPDSEGLNKKKWKEIINPKLGGTIRSFNDTLNKLIVQGLLEDTRTHIVPGWRYYASINIDLLLNEIKTDAKLNFLINPEEKERGILD